jgi:hypothetical protein
MNIDPTGTAVPPPIPPLMTSGISPLGDNPGEREPIPNLIVTIESILRQPRPIMYQLRQPGAGKLMGSMLFVAVVCSLIYGLVVGTFSKGDQLWAAPVKICIGMLISAIICLPSLYIFTCLSGSHARLAEMCGLLCGLLMLMTILLIGFAPVAWLFSESTNSAIWMGVLHLFFWFIAVFFGLRFLAAGFSHSQARSSAGLNTWILVFVLVVLQMTTTLRPIIGQANTFLPKDKKFFIAHWGENLNSWGKTAPGTAEKQY